MHITGIRGLLEATGRSDSSGFDGWMPALSFLLCKLHGQHAQTMSFVRHADLSVSHIRVRSTSAMSMHDSEDLDAERRRVLSGREQFSPATPLVEHVEDERPEAPDGCEAPGWEWWRQENVEDPPPVCVCLSLKPDMDIES